MAVTHLSIVNQKLVNAGTLIGMAIALETPSATSGRLQVRALVDAAILHLGLAYVFYLRELGENYRLKGLAQINQSSQLAVALVSVNKSPSEAQELVTLEQDSQSWLSQMLAAHAVLQRSPEPQKPQKAFPEEGLISVVEVSDAPESLAPADPSIVADWLSMFRALIIRQRDTSAEF